jgi:hypothetical protein
MTRVASRSILFWIAATALLLIVPVAIGNPNQNQQVIFSVSKVSPTFNYTEPTPPPSNTHFGFWIWCEGPRSTNGYSGQCSGSMYFYGLGVTRPVSGTLLETSSGIFTMRVNSPDNEIVCGLENETPQTKAGAEPNTIDVTCPLSPQVPGTIQGSGTASDVVVNLVNP